MLRPIECSTLCFLINVQVHKKITSVTVPTKSSTCLKYNTKAYNLCQKFIYNFTDCFLTVPDFIINHLSPHELEHSLASPGRGVLPTSKSGLKLKGGVGLANRASKLLSEISQEVTLVKCISSF